MLFFYQVLIVVADLVAIAALFALCNVLGKTRAKVAELDARIAELDEEIEALVKIAPKEVVATASKPTPLYPLQLHED